MTSYKFLVSNEFENHLYIFPVIFLKLFLIVINVFYKASCEIYNKWENIYPFWFNIKKFQMFASMFAYNIFPQTADKFVSVKHNIYKFQNFYKSKSTFCEGNSHLFQWSNEDMRTFLFYNLHITQMPSKNDISKKISNLFKKNFLQPTHSVDWRS